MENVFFSNGFASRYFCTKLSVSLLYKTSGPHYRFQQIRDVFFLLFDVLNIFFYNKKVVFLRYNFLFVSRPMAGYPLQLISGPCSIAKYPSSRMANRYNRIFDAG